MNVNLFTPYTAQREFIDLYSNSNHLFGVLVSPRGSGKTLLGVNLLLYWLLKNSGAKGGWISPVYNQAKSVMETISKNGFELIKSQNKSELSIEFINGSTLKFLSSDRPDSVRGFRFEYLVLDEVAYMKKDAIESAILPTLNPNGKKCLMISTPRSKNHFYEYYIRGQQNENDIISYRIQLSDCPYVNPDLIEEAKKSLPPAVFDSEYNALFTDATNDVFIGFSKNCVYDEWENPDRNNRYYAGVDVGISNDYSVISIIDESGRVCFMDRINNLPIEEIANRFKGHLKRYNVASGFVESNGIGRGLFELINKEFRDIKPFYTTQENKMTAVRQLMSDINNDVVMLPTKNLFPALYHEMSTYTFRVNPNGKISFTHPSGLHDDAVDALWMSNVARNELRNTGKNKIYIGRV